MTFLQAKKYRGRMKPVNIPNPPLPVAMPYTAGYTSSVPSDFGRRQVGSINILENSIDTNARFVQEKRSQQAFPGFGAGFNFS